MENWQTTLASIGGTVLAGVLAFVLAAMRQKFANNKEKAIKPFMDKVRDFLCPEFLLPILRNVYQTYTKKVKADGTWTFENWEMALHKAYESVKNQMPTYILNMAKKAYPDYETTIKEKIQIFYEANKDKINVELKDIKL